MATFIVKLLEGDTERASWTQTLTGTLTTYTRALTAGERDSITDWHNLRLRFISTEYQAQVSFAELETPAASPGGSPTTSASTSASASPSASASESPSASPGLPTLDVELWCGATLVSSNTLELTTSLELYEKSLTAEEYALVTDWGNLALTLRADGRQAKVTWAELAATGIAGSASASASPSASYSQSASESGSASASLSPSGSESASPSASGSASASASPSTPSLTLNLYQGAVLIATRDVSATAALTTVGFALEAYEIVNITDWSTLRLELVADGDQSVVSWLALQAPAAAGGSASASASPSASASASRSASPSSSRSASPSGSVSASPSASASRSQSASASRSPSASPSGSVSASPSASASATNTDIQRALAVATIAAGTWTNETGGTALAASIGETIRNDATYIRSAVAPTDDLCKVRLSAIFSPEPGTATLRVVGRWR